MNEQRKAMCLSWDHECHSSQPLAALKLDSLAGGPDELEWGLHKVELLLRKKENSQKTQIHFPT